LDGPELPILLFNEEEGSRVWRLGFSDIPLAEVFSQKFGQFGFLVVG